MRAIAKTDEPYNPTQILFAKSEDNNSATQADSVHAVSGPTQNRLQQQQPTHLPTLDGAYSRLLFYGIAGGHHVYLGQYAKAREYHVLGAILCAALLIFLPLLPAPRPFSPLVALSLLISLSIGGVSILVIWVKLVFDFFRLPALVKLAQAKFFGQESLTDETIMPSLDPSAAHIAYHEESKKRLLTLQKAYLWLLVFGIFGEHKAIVGRPHDMMAYCRLAAITLSPIFYSFAFVVYTQAVLPLAPTDTTAGLICMLLIGASIVAAPIAALVLTTKIIIDIFTLPAAMRRYNRQTQNTLIDRYLVRNTASATDTQSYER